LQHGCSNPPPSRYTLCDPPEAYAALGGIIANAVLTLIEVGVLRVLYRVRRSELWIAIVCLLSVLTLGSLQAVIIAFLLSVIDVVRRVRRAGDGYLQIMPCTAMDMISMDPADPIGAYGYVEMLRDL
jgi:MFS superfamily sulfate permease-like transporter